MESSPVIIPVVLCGGSGTRLWPLSREGYPKQFLRLLGNRSLLQDTLLRSSEVPGVGAPILMAGHGHRFMVAEQAREAGFENTSLILEPHARNTAPAAAWQLCGLWLMERILSFSFCVGSFDSQYPRIRPCSNGRRALCSEGRDSHFRYRANGACRGIRLYEDGAI